MDLAPTAKIAAKIVESLAPYCSKIEVAGSIRRQRPQVNDIDIVCLPNDWEAFQNRVKQKTVVTMCGRENMIVRLFNGIQLDIFVARNATRDLFSFEPSNWGTMLLNRTGSKEFNIWICQQALHQGMKWSPYSGLYRQNKCVASATEEEIFTALGLDYIPPEQRER